MVWKDCGKRSLFRSCTLHSPPVKEIWYFQSPNYYCPTTLVAIHCCFCSNPAALFSCLPYPRNCYTLWKNKCRSNFFTSFHALSTPIHRLEHHGLQGSSPGESFVHKAFDIEKGRKIAFYLPLLVLNLLWNIVRYVPGSLVKKCMELSSGNPKFLNWPNMCLEYWLCPIGTDLSNRATLFPTVVWLAVVILRAAFT